MAKLITPAQRFTKEEWIVSNNNKYGSAENQRSVSERLRAEADRLIDETDKKTSKTLRETNKRLDQRIDDVSYWKSEVDRAADEIAAETEKLQDYRERLRAALAATEEPLHIAHQCLVFREGRKGIDLVHDDVQKDLIKEVEVIDGVRSLLQRTIEQATEQIRLNKSAKYYLEKDINDKFAALHIDDNCLNSLPKDIKSVSAAIMKAALSTVEGKTSTPIDWESFTNEDVLKSEREKQNSITLRALIDGVLDQTHSDMLQAQDNADTSLDKRIRETKDTKAKLEDHLSKVVEEIQDMEGSIGKLKQAIADKQEPLLLAMARIKERENRPNVELCRDPAYYRLLAEVEELNANIQRLQCTLEQSEAELRGLIRNQLSLEEDIDVKANSLAIDEGQCLPLRQKMNHQHH